MTKDDDAQEGKKNLKILEDFSPKIQKHKEIKRSSCVMSQKKIERRDKNSCCCCCCCARNRRKRERACALKEQRARVFLLSVWCFFQKKKGEKVDF